MTKTNPVRTPKRVVRRRGAMWIVLAVAAACGVALWAPPGLSLRGAVPVWQRAPSRARLRTQLTAAAAAVAHRYIATHPPERLGWGWGQGVLVFGLLRAAQRQDKSESLDYVRTYLRHHLARGIEVRCSDDATPALAAAELALHGQRQWLPLAARVARYGMDAPRTSRTGLWVHLGRRSWLGLRAWLPAVWVDSLFHLVPAMLRYGAAVSDERYRRQAVRQLVGFTRALQDPATGLVTHAYDESPRARRVPPWSHRAFWARGNGWMLYTLIDALALLPATDPQRSQLLAAARGLDAGLRAAQDESGLFHTLLLRRETYPETAGSALIASAMARGARLGILPEASRAAALRAATGLLAILRPAARGPVVTGTSLGTNPFEALYAYTPTADDVSYGVGAWLLAAGEAATLLAADPGD